MLPTQRQYLLFRASWCSEHTAPCGVPAARIGRGSLLFRAMQWGEFRPSKGREGDRTNGRELTSVNGTTLPPKLGPWNVPGPPFCLSPCPGLWISLCASTLPLPYLSRFRPIITHLVSPVLPIDLLQTQSCYVPV